MRSADRRWLIARPSSMWISGLWARIVAIGVRASTAMRTGSKQRELVWCCGTQSRMAWRTRSSPATTSPSVPRPAYMACRRRNVRCLLLGGLIPRRCGASGSPARCGSSCCRRCLRCLPSRWSRTAGWRSMAGSSAAAESPAGITARMDRRIPRPLAASRVCTRGRRQTTARRWPRWSSCSPAPVADIDRATQRSRSALHSMGLV
mmetsp:Transcript_111121/g.321176  ORF Transcript_111121/g.321176 Transcript_111121/m.321176 type:complete len:205 (-) Transcript_111121:22-636(-)